MELLQASTVGAAPCQALLALVQLVMEPLSPLQREDLALSEDSHGEEVIQHYLNSKINVIDPILGGRHHFIRRWRNASPVLGGPVKHSSLFYGGGYGAGRRLGMFQRLKMRLGFGKVHYGAGSTVTANSGLGATSTFI